MSTAHQIRQRTNRRMQTGGTYAALTLALSLCAWVTPGCLRAQAKTMPVVPLAVPAPPERVVDATDPQSPPLLFLPEAPVPDTLPRPRPTPPPQRTDVRPPEPPKPDPADAVKPAEETPRLPATPTLQTTPALQEGGVDRRIRTLLAQATSDLNRINIQALNADARTQFDTARRFVSQAEDALRAKNLMFASNLAEKASVLAALLAGR
jgi:hypothetical protein